MWATTNARTETVKVLLQNGADVNTMDNKGNTVLMWATAKGYTGIENLLRSNGAKE